MARYKEITCKSACNKLKRKIPYEYDLNIYRGCEHECKYCFAIYSHKYLDSDDYFGDIHVKTNIVEELEKELKNSRWKRDVINIGGVTDSYQKAEETYKFMPDILKLLIKYKTPCIISTKSDLILRDYELIKELADITYVNIAATITCMDEKIREKLEPGGVSSLKRFNVLKEFSKTKASTGLHVMPIVPYLTDNYENIDGLFSMAKEVDVTYVLPGTLYLRGKTRYVFFDFIKKNYGKLYEELSKLYKTGGASKEYKDRLYKMVNELRNKYKLSSSYTKPMKERLDKANSGQISLLDD